MQVVSFVKELERVGDALPKLEDLSVEVNSSKLLRVLAFQTLPNRENLLSAGRRCDLLGCACGGAQEERLSQGKTEEAVAGCAAG